MGIIHALSDVHLKQCMGADPDTLGTVAALARMI